MPKTEARKAGVIGWPVSHSLSPRLHGYWLKQYGINGTYEALAVEPKDLKQTLRELPERGFVGVNLTVPHKEQALILLDEVDVIARRIGAVNTVIVENKKLRAINTDAYGFIQNLKNHGVLHAESRALVIGAGGASRAICAGLLGEGYEITLINRTRAKAEIFAQTLGGKINVAEWDTYAEVMPSVSLLVNATSLGMKDQPPLGISIGSLGRDAVVTDLVYNPLMTPLLTAAKARGNKVIDGLGMLLYQAQPGFAAWFGVMPEVTAELRAHVLGGLS